MHKSYDLRWISLRLNLPLRRVFPIVRLYPLLIYTPNRGCRLSGIQLEKSYCSELRVVIMRIGRRPWVNTQDPINFLYELRMRITKNYYVGRFPIKIPIDPPLYGEIWGSLFGRYIVRKTYAYFLEFDLPRFFYPFIFRLDRSSTRPILTVATGTIERRYLF